MRFLAICLALTAVSAMAADRDSTRLFQVDLERSPAVQQAVPYNPALSVSQNNALRTPVDPDAQLLAEFEVPRRKIDLTQIVGTEVSFRSQGRIFRGVITGAATAGEAQTAQEVTLFARINNAESAGRWLLKPPVSGTLALVP